MHVALFPENDFTLLAFIVLLPLIGAVVNGIFGKRLGREAVTLMGLGVIAVAFLLSVMTFAMLHAAQEGEHAARFVWQGWDWATLSTQSGATTIGVNLSVDALNGTMALVVTGVGFLIHLYSSKYMAEDPGYHRFFTYLNLFIFSMLVLILGDSLPVLFVGWEGVGLCSYLLIGFWFQDDKNASAGKKAFIVNRIGDFGLLAAMGLLVYYCGALDWSGLEANAKNLLTPVAVWPLGHHFPFYDHLGSAGEWLNTPRYVSAATLVGLALFLGCAGKSAQLPLYVWLPDAMAGPTPVSALIHAATMVTAGVYLVCRTSMVFVLSPAAMFVVAVVGALTALFAATIAFAQNDIKKVLAYSTVSQLGYMFLGVGVGAFSAGFFHVITHAFFKACLFLGAGSVIHAMHARIHDTDASQDMRNMGGLRKYMPITFWTFAASWAAIVGFPGTSGFFSKDEILLKAYTSSIGSPVAGGTIGSGAMETHLFLWPEWTGKLLYGIGWVTAVCTAFYMSRLFFGIFFGDFKGWKIVKGYKAAHDDHGHHDHHAHESGPLEGPTPHESPAAMWVPLAILGALALVSGFLNAGPLHWHAFDTWVEPVFEKAADGVKLLEDSEGYLYPFVGLALLAFGLGVGAAYWVYILQKGEPAKRLTEAAPGLHQWAMDKWRVDEAYDEVVVGSVDALAEISVAGDKWVVDGILARFSAFLVSGFGTVLRYFQTGVVHAYSAFMVAGLAWLGWFLILPRAEAKTVSDNAAGAYSVSAAPGLGYRYRWDVNGDGQWDSEDYGEKADVTFNLDVDQSRKVRLEVKNAFGRTASTEVTLARPKPDKSGAGPTTIEVEPAPGGGLQGVPRVAPAKPEVKP
ncbi:MAG TPA: NADH-quinone oxidoreductase subunit L [Polyangiaceae bacterium]|nr:NADH-quinone oxidoreductase subunit L [Polyangiaceae bacterium]